MPREWASRADSIVSALIVIAMAIVTVPLIRRLADVLVLSAPKALNIESLERSILTVEILHFLFEMSCSLNKI